ncbi:hypothetical protein [Nereida sp. MMG025]|uniref:hypothetical protein n=1 Tax=Nereida sp. MMG025 TaxID=2909981 RepID=UPI00351CFAD2|nr:hypothetical protein [Nereida sp. MMG025]
MKPTELNTQLLAAHAAGNSAALIRLYTHAADQSEENANIDEACFFLTHAYVFALESADAGLPRLAARLKKHGRL